MTTNQASHAERSPDDTAGPTPARVLIAEDNAVNQVVLAAVLQKLGWAADVVPDGAQAVEAVQRGGYAAVLMDCQMPVMDGYDATAAIRRGEPDGTRIPIIAVTASVMQGARERCLAAGMDDYLSKPIMIDEIGAALRRWATRPKDRSGSPPDHPSQDVFDPDRVAELRALDEPGRPDAFVRFATMFCDQATAQMDALAGAMADGDVEVAQREAHELRGGAEAIGAIHLGDACAALERHLRSGSALDSAAPSRIRHELDRVRSAVSELTSPEAP